MNPSRALIKGVVCGVRVEDIEDPTMREIRYLDNLIDELAREKRWIRFYGSNHLKRRNIMVKAKVYIKHSILFL
jgi:hypothetical protein